MAPDILREKEKTKQKQQQKHKQGQVGKGGQEVGLKLASSAGWVEGVWGGNPQSQRTTTPHPGCQVRGQGEDYCGRSRGPQRS